MSRIHAWAGRCMAIQLRRFLNVERISRTEFAVAFFAYCVANYLIFNVAKEVNPLLGINIFGLVKLINEALTFDAGILLKLKRIHYSIVPWHVFLFLIAKLALLPAVALRLRDLGKNPKFARLILIPDSIVLIFYVMKSMTSERHLTPFSLDHPAIELLILVGLFLIQIVLIIDCLFFPGPYSKTARTDTLCNTEPGLSSPQKTADKRSPLTNIILFVNTFLMCLAIGNISLFFAGNIGLTSAQLIIGEMYLYGRVYHRNYEYAFYWLGSASENGSLLARDKLGLMYAKGLGIPKDPGKAYDLWLEGAEKGFASSQYNLAEMYRTGDGVSQDFGQARDWYLKAADQGFRPAQSAFGTMQYSEEYNEWFMHSQD